MRVYLIFASCLLLYFVFAPAINLYYFGGDDYRYLFGSSATSCKLDDGFEFMLTLGRPIQAYLDCLSFKFANTIEKMSVVRLICVMLMGIGMGLLTHRLHKLGLSLFIAFCASGIFFLLPQVYPDVLLYGATALPLSILLVIVAYSCICQANETLSCQHVSSWHPGWYFTGMTFILCSMLAYPATSFFYVVLVLLKILFSPIQNWSVTRKQVSKELIVFFIAGVLYFVWGYYTMHYHPLTPVSGSYQLDHPNINSLEVLKRFIFLTNVFNGQWTLSRGVDTRFLGYLTIFFISSGIIINVIKNLSYFRTRYGLKILSEISIYTILTLIISVAFILVMPSLETLENRVLLGRTAACFALVLWGFLNLVSLFKNYLKKLMIFIALAVFFIIQAYQANMITMASAISHEEYLNLDKTAIANYFSQNNSLQRIHFIIPKDNYPYDRFFMAYAALVSQLKKESVNIKWCSQPRGSAFAEKDSQKETLDCVKKLENKVIAITYSFEGEKYKNTNNMLVIKNHYLDINPRTLSAS